MTTIRTNNPIYRIFLLVGIPLVTTLLLLIGTIELHAPGFSLLAFANASSEKPTCASTRGAQQDLCDQENPLKQGCTRDAQLVEMVSVFTIQNTLIGEADLFHSQTCKTIWVRTIAYAHATIVQSVDATISFNDGKVQDHTNSYTRPGHSLVALTDMSQATMTPKTVVGVFHLKGQAPPVTIPL